MNEQLVTFKTAKLAKENKFREYCTSFFYSDEKPGYSCFGNSNRRKVIARPTQSLLQKWLRENHNIVLWVMPVNYNTRYMVKGVIRHGILEHELIVNEWKDTYEEALEFGLQEALKLINHA